MKRNNHLIFFLGLYSILLLTYAVFSYSLTAPNLILSNNATFWKFQTWMWKTFFNNRQLLSYTFISIMIALIVVYGMILWNWRKLKTHKKEHHRDKGSLRILSRWWMPILVTIPLLISNNALSYDVFNYIFNAKMVLVYRANPHVTTALNFAYDDWTRFMHNTHTPAPYFYGWTVISLIPYVLGMGKFLPTWILFRLFAVVSFTLLCWLVWKYGKRNNNSQKNEMPTFQTQTHQDWSWQQLALLLNPLLIIEVISNAHNDLWMMVPAVGSLLLVANKGKSSQTHLPLSRTVWSIVLLGFSVSIKYATVVLLPVWLLLVLPWQQLLPKKMSFVHKTLKTLIDWGRSNWSLLASVGLFLPLFTAQSKQFLPWYLVWSLVWIPFMHQRWNVWSISLLVLSVSALGRYLPYLWAGNYDGSVSTQQLLITWLPWLSYWLIVLLIWIWRRPVSPVK